jgi:two-component system, OmpR family, KDP operon response regulator KdpE
MKDKRLKILIVDDEPAIRKFLHASLAIHDNTILEAENGNIAIDIVEKDRPDLIILDLGLPDMDGIDVIQAIREWNQVPIIILSVRNNEAGKIEALDAGADDYLTKPFGVGELLAHIRAVMKRVSPPISEEIYQIAHLKMDVARHTVSLDEEEIFLTPTEFDILYLLMKNAGKVITHRQIIAKIWGTNTGDEGRSLRVNISNLRHKIEPDSNRPIFIQTEVGIGYRLNDSFRLSDNGLFIKDE